MWNVGFEVLSADKRLGRSPRELPRQIALAASLNATAAAERGYFAGARREGSPAATVPNQKSRSQL
jgi:hypothetical protein